MWASVSLRLNNSNDAAANNDDEEDDDDNGDTECIYFTGCKILENAFLGRRNWKQQNNFLYEIVKTT